MRSISNYEQDESAMGRINAWWMAWNLAVDRPLGGGFDIYSPQVFARYAPSPGRRPCRPQHLLPGAGRARIRGPRPVPVALDHGVADRGYLRRTGPLRPTTQWTADLGAMTQASLAGYAVGGAFLSLAYFDLPYNFVLLVVLARQWIVEKGWEREAVAAPTAGATRAVSRTGFDMNALVPAFRHLSPAGAKGQIVDPCFPPRAAARATRFSPTCPTRGVSLES